MKQALWLEARRGYLSRVVRETPTRKRLGRGEGAGHGDIGGQRVQARGAETQQEALRQEEATECVLFG